MGLFLVPTAATSATCCIPSRQLPACCLLLPRAVVQRHWWARDRHKWEEVGCKVGKENSKNAEIDLDRSRVQRGSHISADIENGLIHSIQIYMPSVVCSPLWPLCLSCAQGSGAVHRVCAAISIFHLLLLCFWSTSIPPPSRREQVRNTFVCTLWVGRGQGKVDRIWVKEILG